MSPLEEPHSLWTIAHITAPFVVVYETGDPRIALALVLFWELVEWIIFTSYGHYGALFMNHPTEESLWDVWGLDVGGGVFGILLAVSFHYFQAENTGDFWAPFVPTPRGRWWVRALRFLGFAIIIALPSSFGWHCIEFFPSICVDGYHTLPWGAFGIIPLLALYVWWAELPKLSYALVGVLFIPVFVPVTSGSEPVPASFIQFILAAGLSVPVFVGCLVHRCQNKSKYNILRESRTRRQTP